MYHISSESADANLHHSSACFVQSMGDGGTAACLELGTVGMWQPAPSAHRVYGSNRHPSMDTPKASPCSFGQPVLMSVNTSHLYGCMCFAGKGDEFWELLWQWHFRADSPWGGFCCTSCPCFSDHPPLLFHTPCCSPASQKRGDAMLCKQARIPGGTVKRTLIMSDFTSCSNFKQTKSSDSPQPPTPSQESPKGPSKSRISLFPDNSLWAPAANMRTKSHASPSAGFKHVRGEKKEIAAGF